MQISILTEDSYPKTLNLIRFSDISLNWSDKQIFECFDSNNHIVIGSFDKSDLVSVAIFSYILDTSELLYTCVSPNYRNRSIAYGTLKESFTYLLNLNIKDIFLEVNINNNSAKKLYVNLGFKQINIRKKYYKKCNGLLEDALIMKYELYM